MWWFYSAELLNFTTTALSLLLLREEEGENTMKKGSRVEIRARRFLTNYRRGQNRLSTGRLV